MLDVGGETVAILPADQDDSDLALLELANEGGNGMRVDDRQLLAFEDDVDITVAIHFAVDGQHEEEAPMA